MRIGYELVGTVVAVRLLPRPLGGSVNLEVVTMKRKKTPEERRQELIIGRWMLAIFILMFLYAAVETILA